MTTRIRSGCFSTLVPCSACAVSTADVRLKTKGSPAPTPIPYNPRARKSRREQPQPNCICLRDISNSSLLYVVSAFRRTFCGPAKAGHYVRLAQLIFRRTQHEIKQLTERFLQLLAGPDAGRAKLVAEEGHQEAPLFVRKCDGQKPVDEIIHDLVDGVRTGRAGHRREVDLRRIAGNQ